MTCSPLRYPGGKSKLYGFIEAIIASQDKSINTYIEPFAGGAGIGISLLLNEKVENIIINDLNKGVYSFWRAICTETDKFLSLLEKTSINKETYLIQKNIYQSSNKYSLEYGFSTFFLNRTNYSGILDSGPIGGMEQTGNFKMDARYNKDILAEKIKKISKYKHNIKIYNKDIIIFNNTIVTKTNDAFVYYDPPYYIKGKNLYTNFLEHTDHINIHNSIKSVKQPWILTYDNASEIASIYKDSKAYEFTLSYSVNSKNVRKATELMYMSDSNFIKAIPTTILNKINLKERR